MVDNTQGVDHQSDDYLMSRLHCFWCGSFQYIKVPKPYTFFTVFQGKYDYSPKDRHWMSHPKNSTAEDHQSITIAFFTMIRSLLWVHITEKLMRIKDTTVM